MCPWGNGTSPAGNGTFPPDEAAGREAAESRLTARKGGLPANRDWGVVAGRLLPHQAPRFLHGVHQGNDGDDAEPD